MTIKPNRTQDDRDWTRCEVCKAALPESMQFNFMMPDGEVISLCSKHLEMAEQADLTEGCPDCGEEVSL